VVAVTADYPLGSVWTYHGESEFYSGAMRGARVIVSNRGIGGSVSITLADDNAPHLTIYDPHEVLTPAVHDQQSTFRVARIYADRVHRQAWPSLALVVRRQLAVEAIELADTLLALANDYAVQCEKVPS